MASQLAARALGCWRLSLSVDPRDSVPLLEQLLGDLAAIGSTSDAEDASGTNGTVKCLRSGCSAAAT
jgi:hypothetical protein